MGNKHSRHNNKVFIAPSGDQEDELARSSPTKGETGPNTPPVDDSPKARPKYAGIYIGCQVLCRDEFQSKYTGEQKHKWRPAEIVEVDGLRVLIHFAGWSNKHDRWIDLETQGACLAPLRLLPADQRENGDELTEKQADASYEYLMTGQLPPGCEVPYSEAEDAMLSANSFEKQPSSRLMVQSGRSRTNLLQDQSCPSGRNLLPSGPSSRGLLQSSPSGRNLLQPAGSARNLMRGMSMSAREYVVGQKVEVQDIYKTKNKDIVCKWRDAEIVEVSGTMVKIHYAGWDDKWDTVIDLTKNKERIRMPGCVIVAAVDDQGPLDSTRSSSRRRSLNDLSPKLYNDEPAFLQEMKSERSLDSAGGSPMGSSRFSRGGSNSDLSARSGGSAATPISRGGSARSLGNMSGRERSIAAMEIQRHLSAVKEEDEVQGEGKRRDSLTIGTGTGDDDEVKRKNSIGATNTVQKFSKLPSLDEAEDLPKIREALAAAKRRMSVEETINQVAQEKRPMSKQMSSRRLRRDDRRASASWTSEPLDTGRRAELAEDAFIDRLEKAGLQMIEVQYDGNCLFRAVSYLLYETEDRHDELRKQCVEHMEKYRSRFELFYTGNLDEHLKDMKRVGIYAGELEIKALEEVLDRVFSVYSIDSLQGGMMPVPINVNLDECNLLGGVAPVKLSYHGKNRYNVVIDEKQTFPLEQRKSTMLLYERVKTFEAMFPEDSWDDDGEYKS